MKKKLRQIGVGGFKIGPLEKRYILDALKNQRLSYGPYLRGFEKEFAKAHKRKFAIFTNSGTSALQVSLHALKELYKWRDGDEILVPALTFPATVNIVLQNNLEPVFVDVTGEFYDIDPQKIEEKIGKRTKAIIPVHIGGQPCDMEPILKIAKKHKLKILEDSCETMFVKYKGESVGSWGDASCFSTYAAHIIVTGVGGFATTNDPQLAILIKSLVNHGRDGIYISMDDDQTENLGELFRIVDRRFNFILPGYSYRGTELEGAIGLAQLKRKDEIVKKRQENAAYLTQGLREFAEFLQLPKPRAGSEHAFMFYPILIINERIKREELVFFLEEHHIETRYLLPLLNQPVYKKIFGNIEKKYPVASYVARNGFYIGCHPELSKSDLAYVIENFRKFFKRQGWKTRQSESKKTKDKQKGQLSGYKVA